MSQELSQKVSQKEKEMKTIIVKLKEDMLLIKKELEKVGAEIEFLENKETDLEEAEQQLDSLIHSMEIHSEVKKKC